MGFFYEQASSTFQWAGSTLEALDILSTRDLVEEVGGSFVYYTYVLSDFDPIKANRMQRECSIEDVTLAMMARQAYYKKDKK